MANRGGVNGSKGSGRTVFAWGRIPAGRGRSSGAVSRLALNRFGVYPRSEQLGFFSDSEGREATLRELRLPGGGPAPLPGPWTLSAIVSGSSPA